MTVYIMLPFIVLKVDTERAKYLSALTEDYATQFHDAEYAYPTGSKLIRKKAHYTGSIDWIYTQMPPQVFELYEGGRT